MKRPALQSPTSHELLVFCTEKCREVYRSVGLALIRNYIDVETPHIRPLNCFGNPTWRAACSTCGRSFDGTPDEPVNAKPVMA